MDYPESIAMKKKIETMSRDDLIALRDRAREMPIFPIILDDESDLVRARSIRIRRSDMQTTNKRK